MPLPLLFIVPAALSGAVGAGKTVKAGIDASKAKRLNQTANEIVEEATDRLNHQREACSKALESLGEEKLFMLNNSIKRFVNTFSRIKNIDFSQVEDLEEIKRLHIDSVTFEELEKMTNFAASIAEGAVLGTAGGAVTAFGAYGAAGALASASTGTAISTLSGAAATNATLAFFGGGSLASGGLGMAGGAMVLGGLVAGPALLVMGLVAGAKTEKGLEQAKENKAEAERLSDELDVSSVKCDAIRRRAYMIYCLLARLDSYYLPLVFEMEDIVANEGIDYRDYSIQSKKTIAMAASFSSTIKTVLDTYLLDKNGNVTEESGQLETKVSGLLN